MQGKIDRHLFSEVKRRLGSNPAVAILGPRQCGKTTLAKQIIDKMDNAVYLDLENPADLAKLDDPLTFFSAQRGKMVCLDEIQRKPELFEVLRSVIDREGTDGLYLILGSASRDLIRQSSETLAGRIAYLQLTPFLLTETSEASVPLPWDLWIRGGFPRSRLASSLDDSFLWRQDFITTFLERDVSMLGFRIPPLRLRRLWQMCAHTHGQLLNVSTLSGSLGVSSHTVRTYIDLFEQTFMLRILEPYHVNVKKRLTKSPKIYVRDTGILHALLSIRTPEQLMGHPILGGSFEGFVIENIVSSVSGFDAFFYRTAVGAEMDLVLVNGSRTIALEIKAGKAPSVSKGFWNALEDIHPDTAYVVAPVDEPYPIRNNVTVAPLHEVISRLRKDYSIL